MICRLCGHSETAHDDRAFIACIADSNNPARCWCAGFNARREHRTAATSQPPR